MASDDHDEHVRGAIAVALVVVLTYLVQETAPSQDLGGAGSGSGCAREHGDDGGGRERGWR